MYIFLRIIFFIFIFSLVGCLSSEGGHGPSDFSEKALKIARGNIILDSHMDVPYRLMEDSVDLTIRSDSGHFDYIRAREGGLNLAFFAVYIPASYQETGGARDLADWQIRMIRKIIERHPDKFVLITEPEQVADLNSSDKIGFALGIENGAALEGQMNNLAYFYDQGVRYITLCHSKSNRICDSSFDPDHQWNGLSPFGKELIEEMNNLGMMIDVAHVSDQAFYQIMELSQTPVIASHSACRALTPGFERNLDDNMIQFLTAKEGVIQVPFGSFFLIPESEWYDESYDKAIEEYKNRYQLPLEAPQFQEYIEQLKENYQIEPGTVSDLVDHIDHIAELAGVDYVGFGSDFEGISTVPQGVRDVSDYPAIIQELLRRGYTEADIPKITGQNFLRVWRSVKQSRQRDPDV